MLTKIAIEALKKNETAKGRIADALGKSIYTVNRWIYANDAMLTTAVSLQIISEETGLTQDEILEPQLAGK